MPVVTLPDGSQRPFDHLTLDFGRPVPLEIGHGLEAFDARQTETPFQAAAGTLGQFRLHPGFTFAKPARKPQKDPPIVERCRKCALMKRVNMQQCSV